MGDRGTTRALALSAFIAIAAASAGEARGQVAPQPAGSTAPLAAERERPSRLDDLWTIIVRAGGVAGGQTGFDANAEFLFAETMGFGVGYLATGDAASQYLRFTVAMLDINYYLLTGYLDLIATSYTDEFGDEEGGFRYGLAFSIPLRGDLFLRVAVDQISGPDVTNVGGGLEYALW